MKSFNTIQARPTRRDLLRTGIVASTAVISPWFRRAHAAGSNNLRVGLVGCGGRGTGAAISAIQADSRVQIVAAADVFPDRVESVVSAVAKQAGTSINITPDRQYVGFDAFERLIESDVDAVILATPPGFRPQHFEAAVNAGKHVYLEKPLAVDAPGARRISTSNASAVQKGLAVGVGFQRRHSRIYQETIKRIHAGAVGSVESLHAAWKTRGIWLRKRMPQQTEMDYQLRNWYYFVWQSGDIIVEQHTHNLDICNWIKNDHPVRAQGHGGRTERHGPDHGEIFDHFEITYTYSDGTSLLSESSHLQGGQTGVFEKVKASRGDCDVSRGEISGPAAWRFTGQNNNPYASTMEKWIGAIFAGERYNEVDYAVESTLTGIMGRNAAYLGRTVTWEEVMDSREAFLPEAYEMNAARPTTPDKFGDYRVPAVGKIV